MRYFEGVVISFRKITEKRQLGQTLVIFALALTAIVAVVGLVIDGGRVYFERVQLQRSADMAALSGAWQYYHVNYENCQTQGTFCNGAPGYTGTNGVSTAAKLAKQKAQAVVRANTPNILSSSIQVCFRQKAPTTSPSLSSCAVTPPESTLGNLSSCISSRIACPGVAQVRGVTVIVTNPSPLFFLQILGIQQATVAATATAMMGQPTGGPIEGLLLQNYSDPFDNILRGNVYGSAVGQCLPNPGDGTQYLATPDCRPKISNLTGTGSMPVNLIPSYEGSEPVPLVAPFNNSPVSSADGGLGKTPWVKFFIMHDSPLCSLGDVAPGTYSPCAASLLSIEKGLQGSTTSQGTQPGEAYVCSSSPCGNQYKYYAEIKRSGSNANTVKWSQPGELSPPSERAYAAMAYGGGTSNEILLFGGYSSAYQDLGDTWIGKLQANGSWKWIAGLPCGAACPPARSDASMAYDSKHSMFIMFGGHANGVGALADTWLYSDSSGWKKYVGTGPGARWFAAMAEDHDTQNPSIILFGGLNDVGGYLADTWAWNENLPTPGWVGPPNGLNPAGLGQNPPGRWETNMALGAPGGGVLIYGGDNGSTNSGVPAYLSDLWVFHCNPLATVPCTLYNKIWEPITPGPNPIGPRTNLQVAFNTQPGGSALFFGGGSGSNCPGTGSQECNDTQILSSNGFIPSGTPPLPPSTSPPPTRSAGMVFVPSNNGSPDQVVMFGGSCQTGVIGCVGTSSVPGQGAITKQLWVWKGSNTGTILDDHVWAGMNERISRAIAVGSPWVNQDCSQPQGGAGLVPLTSDNPRLVRLPINYSAAPIEDVSFQTNVQTNVGSVFISETIMFCVQYGYADTAKQLLPMPDTKNPLTGAYTIPGFFVSEPNSDATILSGNGNSDYLGHDVVVRLVQ